MIVNADFALKAVVHTQTMPWEKSPIEGVGRKYLDRVGGGGGGNIIGITSERTSKFNNPVSIPAGSVFNISVLNDTVIVSDVLGSKRMVLLGNTLMPSRLLVMSTNNI